MPRTSARPDSDSGLPYLEAKLGVFTHGPSKIRRNPALDILTGRGADYWLVPVPAVAGPDEPSSAGSRQSARSRRLDVLNMTGAALPGVDWLSRLPASPWLAKSAEPPVRLHIVRPTAPTQPARRHMPSWVLAAMAAGVVLGAGFELRTLADRAGPAGEPSPAPVAAAIAEPNAVPLEAPVAEVVAVEPLVSPAEVAVPPVEVPDVSPPVLAISPPVPVPASEFGLLLDENFTSNARHWPSDPQGTAWLAGGAYQLVGRQATHFVAVGIPGTQKLGDSVVTGSFRKVGGPDGGGYGLILRDQEPEARDGLNQFGHYYVFEAGDRGQVGLWLRDGDRWVDLLTWTASDAVRRGTASNELTVSAIGDHLSFLVNGVPVASQTDTVLHSGAAGVFVGGDGNEVALDRIAVRVPR